MVDSGDVSLASLASANTDSGSPASQATLWRSFILRRLVGLVFVLTGLALATFLMVRLIPGDPALNIAGLHASQEQLEAIRHQLGLDAPLLSQLGSFASDLARGDLGHSFITHQPVSDLLWQRMGSSVELAAVCLVVVLGVSLPVGILLGARTHDGRHRRLEVGVTALSSVFASLPEYLLATLLALVFAVWLRVLPVAGSEGWQSLVLPVLAVSLRPIAVLTSLVRAETANVLSADYIRTARSKRLPATVIYARHVFPNVATAALTIGGMIFAAIIGGAVVVENVFARSGLGTALVSAVLNRDYPVIQGTVLALGIIVVVVNAVVDILTAVVDPRALNRTG